MNIGRWLIWSLYALMLIAAPLLFKSSLFADHAVAGRLSGHQSAWSCQHLLAGHAQLRAMRYMLTSPGDPCHEPGSAAGLSRFSLIPLDRSVRAALLPYCWAASPPYAGNVLRIHAGRANWCFPCR
jgi:hypothetical protein